MQMEHQNIESRIENLLIRTHGAGPIKTWLFRMQKYLDALGLKDVLNEETRKYMDPLEFQRKDRMAQHIIISHLKNESLNDIENKGSAKEIWETINERYTFLVANMGDQEVRMF